MGFLDEVGSLLGSNSGVVGAIEMGQQLLSENGGIQGLLDKLKDGGLLTQINNGQAPSVEQIQALLGNEQVAAIAAKMGIDPQKASELIAQYLPDIVSNLGTGGGGVLAAGESLLKGFMKR